MRVARAVAAVCAVSTALLFACTEQSSDSPEVQRPTGTPTPTSVAAPAVATPSATPSPAPTPHPSFTIANTDGDGVAVRDACDDSARVSAPGQGIPEDTVVVLVEVGDGECAEWMNVRTPDGRQSWVRLTYLEALPGADTATPVQTPTSARDDHPVVLETDAGSAIHLETVRQAELILYYMEIRTYFGPSDHNLNGWRDATMKYLNNQASTTAYYQYTRSAFDAHHYLARRWMSDAPNPPEGLLDVTSFVTGVLQKRGDAMGHFALAIGTGDDEEASLGEELLKQADAGVAYVVLKIRLAANEAGINWGALDHVIQCDADSRGCGLRSPDPGLPLLLSDCPHGTRVSQLDSSVLICRD